MSGTSKIQVQWECDNGSANHVEQAGAEEAQPMKPDCGQYLKRPASLHGESSPVSHGICDPNQMVTYSLNEWVLRSPKGAPLCTPFMDVMASFIEPSAVDFCSFFSSELDRAERIALDDLKKMLNIFILRDLTPTKTWKPVPGMKNISCGLSSTRHYYGNPGIRDQEHTITIEAKGLGALKILVQLQHRSQSRSYSVATLNDREKQHEVCARFFSQIPMVQKDKLLRELQQKAANLDESSCSM